MDNFNIAANNLQGIQPYNDELTNETEQIWKSIKEWFSPKWEPLAYEYLNNIYNNDQLMTGHEQLESFLTLRSIAAPGHQCHFTTGYMNGMEVAECSLTSYSHGLVETVLIPLSEPDYYSILAKFAKKD